MPTKELTTVVRSELPVEAKKLAVSLEIDGETLSSNVAELNEGYSTMEIASKQLMVRDDESNQNCLNLRAECSKRERGMAALWKRLKDPLNSVRAIVLDLEHRTVDPWKKLKEEFDKKSTKYILDQKRAKSQADLAMARAADEERQKLQQQADALMARGRIKEAREMEQQVQATVTPVIPDVVERVQGASITDKFKGTVTDPMAVLRAIVDGKVALKHEIKGEQRPLVIVDQVVVNALVARMGKDLRIPGITVSPDVQIRSR